VTTQPSKLLIFAVLALALPLGCKDKPADAPKAELQVLDAASNGSPISAKLVKFTGEGEGRGMEVLLYNTSDKTAASYFFLFRYYDANDKPLKVKPGTPFESDTDFTSMSGGKYKCEPKQNATLEIDGRIVAVPAEAVRAEILATQVRAIAADGNTIEDWFSQDNFNDWPAG
jgi:hypothetical protein